MNTTIKVSKETKNRLLQLDIANKGKTFDMLVNELITYREKNEEEYNKDRKEWKESFNKYKKDTKKHDKNIKQYKEEKATWDRLLIWAKKKGFKE